MLTEQNKFKIMRQIKATILFIVFFIISFLGLTRNASSQCVVGSFDIPACVTPNTNVVFLNTTDDSGVTSSSPWSNNSCTVDYR